MPGNTQRHPGASGWRAARLHTTQGARQVFHFSADRIIVEAGKSQPECSNPLRRRCHQWWRWNDASAAIPVGAGRGRMPDCHVTHVAPPRRPLLRISIPQTPDFLYAWQYHLCQRTILERRKPVSTPAFNQTNLFQSINEQSAETLDMLPFGIIGFDHDCIVQRYNAYEAKAAGLSVEHVLGNNLFTVVAPCMNNFMVAQRFEDALASRSMLDETIDYVLTLRMRPSPVKLRLLASPDANLRYVAVQRLR